MSLDGALSIATGGLGNINRQLSLISHNIANAGTPGYVAETASQEALTADGYGLGVRTLPASRDLDLALQAQVFQQGGQVAGLQARQAALAAIDAVHGTPGQGQDLASLLGDLSDQFTTLLSGPESAPQQTKVVASAATLAQGINALSDAYTTQRQATQDAIAQAVDTIDSTLATIGQLSTSIIALRSSNVSTADLESQRDVAVQSLSQLVGVKAFTQPNGDMLLTTTGGLSLPTHAASPPLATSDAGVPPGAYYPAGGIPAISMGGADVTGQLSGGRLGALITLRDNTLPTFQAELDEFAQTLATRFGAQGLTLFTDPNGAVPPGGGAPVQNTYVGFSATIRVNPAVQANPSLVRDGTTAIGGSPTGASAFTPNPLGGPAGFTTLIERVLDYALGAEAQPGVPQPPANTAGLGADGKLAAPYAAPATLGGLAATLVASQGQDSANTSDQLDTAQALQTTLSQKLATGSGVDIDKEMATMIQLQNAYAANAKILGAVQAMWSQLLGSVH